MHYRKYTELLEHTLIILATKLVTYVIKLSYILLPSVFQAYIAHTGSASSVRIKDIDHHHAKTEKAP